MQVISGTQILGVESSPTKTGGTRYKINLANGTSPSCFDLPLATKAQQLMGQVVDVRVEQKGDFWNFKDVAPAGSFPPAALPAGTPLGAPTAFQSTPSTIPQAPQGEDPIERSKRIVRQNVLGTSFGFVGQLFTGAGDAEIEQAKGVALQLARELYEIAFNGTGGAVSPSAAPVAVAPAVVPQTPQEVVQQVQEVMGGAAPVTTGVQW